MYKNRKLTLVIIPTFTLPYLENYAILYSMP